MTRGAFLAEMRPVKGAFRGCGTKICPRVDGTFKIQRELGDTTTDDQNYSVAVLNHRLDDKKTIIIKKKNSTKLEETCGVVRRVRCLRG